MASKDSGVMQMARSFYRLAWCLLEIALASNADLYWIPNDSGNTRPAGYNFTWANAGNTGPIVGRADIPAVGWICGKVSTQGLLNIVYGGNNYIASPTDGSAVVTDFEILVYDDLPGTELYWVAATDEGVPQGAVTVGLLADGTTSYVTRVWNPGASEFTPSSYASPNDYSEYRFNGVVQSADWDYLVLKYVPHLEVAMYGDSQVVDRNSLFNPTPFQNLTDGENGTCVDSTRGNNGLLQAAFSFQNFTTVGYMTVEVVMANTFTCSTTAWTWFAGSECATGSYRECFLSGERPSGGGITCIVDCICTIACDYFYTKNNWVPWEDQEGHAVCEVNLVYELVEENGQVFATANT